MIRLTKDWSIRRDSNCFTLIKKIVPTEPNEDGKIAPPRLEPKGYFTSLDGCLNQITKLHILGKKDIKSLEDISVELKNLYKLFIVINNKIDENPEEFNKALISSEETLDYSEE